MIMMNTLNLKNLPCFLSNSSGLTKQRKGPASIFSYPFISDQCLSVQVSLLGRHEEKRLPTWGFVQAGLDIRTIGISSLLGFCLGLTNKAKHLFINFIFINFIGVQLRA